MKALLAALMPHLMMLLAIYEQRGDTHNTLVLRCLISELEVLVG